MTRAAALALLVTLGACGAESPPFVPDGAALGYGETSIGARLGGTAAVRR